MHGATCPTCGTWVALPIGAVGVAHRDDGSHAELRLGDIRLIPLPLREVGS